ncbi:hypothetical protein [Aeromicrobium wangtongii]|uniref:Major facilitator superfamily (MFS) profile domain-containing protein n=1 Tax=Aeromicrobium wangtongii TaxID=2969247 RepID=A0ABY5M7Y6_9ACTN|nr:hypothetical protein [Aeromicrobium wangtongii]MCD9198745.1 hypothetical protein [Aeromicrobium wangtongii]UUP13209.1 hypothetical protein NQV15_15335 [Aeromicrobium wangtongii]
MTSRHPSGFRFSDEFIKRWTNRLVIAIFAIGGIGIGLSAATEIDGSPDWLGTVAAIVLIGGVVGPLLAAAVLGGESIRRGGGLVGVLLVGGLGAGGAGQVIDRPWLTWCGAAAVALSVIGFWAMGWIAKVPMYIGLPWAHGDVVQRDDSAPKDLFGGDDPRLRPRRPRGGSASRGPRR